MITPRAVISVRGVGKRFDLGETFSSNTFRDALTAGMRRIIRRLGKKPTTARREFWALKDVTFDVAEGDVLGIIGPNGAGKSTLLKILSQITEPTNGEIRVRGRVASLLEVGTGFHQELSGRENIFMNGAILGMTQAEIRRRFDEIVAFAGIDQFIDTPVKRYSSGMVVRLGFSVAAHLEPEILVVDEVLAVGDVEFQRKCLGKMGEVSQSGRTVLFVSHNMAAVQAFCRRAVLLDRGQLLADSATDQILAQYDELTRPNGHGEVVSPTSSIEAVRVGDDATNLAGIIVLGSDMYIRIVLSEHYRGDAFNLAVVVYDSIGTRLMTSYSAHYMGRSLSGADGKSFECRIEEVRLFPGRYRLSVVLQEKGRNVDSLDTSFTVRESDLLGTGRLPRQGSGVLIPKAAWVGAA
jgi:lipopolysaccharide transport system ATP-binding protein